LYFKAEVVGKSTYEVQSGDIVSLSFIADQLDFTYTATAAATDSVTVDLASAVSFDLSAAYDETISLAFDSVSAPDQTTILLMGQTDPTKNGVYRVTVDTISTTLVKLTENYAGLYVTVTGGATNAGKTFYQTSADSSLVFEEAVVTITKLNYKDIVVSYPDPSAQISITFTGYGPGVPQYNPGKLFNYVDKELITDIPLWHPAAGIHTPTAMECINIISSQNPAKYNYSNQVANNNSYDPLRPWGSNEVGRVWFDTTNLEYIPYYDSIQFTDRNERLSRWGSLAESASVDVYEWVESTVPPSEFDALAAEQAGNADLDSSTKAAGEAALEKTYTRAREWSIRPIAWSHAGVASAAAHPAFSGSYKQNLTIDGTGTAYLQAGTFADFGIVAGMHLGAWDPNTNNPKPLSEYLVNDAFTKKLLPSTTEVNVGDFTVSIAVGNYTSVTGTVSFDAALVTPVVVLDSAGETVAYEFPAYLTASTGAASQTVTISSLTSTTVADPGQSLTAGQVFTYTFDLLGLIVSVTVNNTNTFAADAISTAIETALGSSFTIYDAVTVTELVAPAPGLAAVTAIALVNDSEDPQYQEAISTYYGLSFYDNVVAVSTSSTLSGSTVDGVSVSTGDLVLVINQGSSSGVYEVTASGWVKQTVPDNSFVYVESGVTYQFMYFQYTGTDFEQVQAPGWQAWSVPTQAELDADSTYPNSSWAPYYGDYVSYTPSQAQIAEAVTYVADPLVLNNGTSIVRYKTTWSDWSVLQNTVLTGLQEQAGSMTLVAPSVIDSTKVAVYVNGIAQLAASYSISGKKITLTNVKAGARVRVVIQHYEPSSAELAFDPDTADNLAYQVQYKNGYEYVAVPVRDETDGAISSYKYYFWVKNKTTTAKGKSLSVQAITQYLINGPTNYLTMQPLDSGLLGSGTTADPYRYDAITIANLSYIVSKDDTFKLRLTQNFTLRDDPEDLNLKDTHTEWSLIRAGQRSKIPEPLWNKLVDSMCGEDAAGNTIPALRRTLYDERNGSSTQFGFGPEQTLAPQDLLISTVTYTIVNTKLTDRTQPQNADGSYPADFIDFLDFTQSDTWFATAASTRSVMTQIWTQADAAQINEIFFAVLNDLLAYNYEPTDIFKTSRLSAYSIKVVPTASTVASSSYE
jgi:hypothetical protein